MEEFDAEKYERTIREEGREEGIREGLEEGICRGIEIFRRRTDCRLLLKRKIMEKYAVSKEETERRLVPHWK